MLTVVSTQFYENDDNYTDNKITLSDPRTCDHEIHFYTLTHTENASFKRFSLAKVPFSNLILIVVDDLMDGFVHGIDLEYPTPKEVVYNVGLECIRARGENLTRRNLTECFNEVSATVRCK